MQRGILLLLVTLVVIFGAVGATAADHASIDVTQEPGDPATVTVTDVDNESVANASVTVERATDDEPEYDGTGNYTTGENGTVELPAPETTVDVLVTATVDNETVSTDVTLEYLPELDLTVEQETGQPATVTVIADNESAKNATVAVEPVDENATYEGTGVYTTDENGTVELPTPNATVEVNVSAAYEDATTATTATLEAPLSIDVRVDQDGPGLPATVLVLLEDEPADNVTVAVELFGTENDTYTGIGTYTTDENGSVYLPGPEETVDVTVTATVQGVDEMTFTTLQGTDAIDESLPFGQQLQQFKQTVDTGDRRGYEIATWVTDNNPGNPPAFAGPGNTTGQAAAGNDNGPPSHVNRSDDENAGSASNDTGNGGVSNETGNGGASDAGNGGGNSNGNGGASDAGNGGGNGNGNAGGNGNGNGGASDAGNSGGNGNSNGGGNGNGNAGGVGNGN